MPESANVINIITAADARASTSRRWLWWLLAGLGVVAAGVVGWVFLRKSPVQAAVTVLDAVTAKVAALDAQARVQTAVAAGLEQAKVERVEVAAKIADPVARAQAFADLAREDY